MRVFLMDKARKVAQQAYSDWLANQNAKSRVCQQQMMAEITNSLSEIKLNEDGRRTNNAGLVLLEAGTGTGKTLAYLLAALPVAQVLRKKLVIATATITLQDQLIAKDLPEILANTGLRFSYALAKGQKRYSCIRRLDREIQEQHLGQAHIAPELPGLGGLTKTRDTNRVYPKLLERFNAGKWNGDRDSWSGEAIEDNLWYPVAVERKDCINKHCPFYNQCPYFKARKELHGVDVIVTNHDLLLSDLQIGGGMVLPLPENTIYVIDEGHHLPERALYHLKSRLDLQAAKVWLDSMETIWAQLTQKVPQDATLKKLSARCNGLVASFSHALAGLQSLVNTLLLGMPKPTGMAERDSFRFRSGIIPDTLAVAARQLQDQANPIHDLIDWTRTYLQQAANGDSATVSESLATNYLPIIKLLAAELTEMSRLLDDYGDAPVEPFAPTAEQPTDIRARWLGKIQNRNGTEDARLNSSPVLCGSFLAEELWGRACGVVITSATLRSLGNFDYFRLQSGLPEYVTDFYFKSPFSFEENGVLTIPPGAGDGSNQQVHTECLVDLLPDLIEPKVGTLVIYPSLTQLDTVRSLLPDNLQDKILAQYDYSRSEVLRRHRERIDAGHTSVLFGVTSFAEGIDLPGAYCRHVIIARLSFPVPSEPIYAALAEWIESRGGNSFMRLGLPVASIRLVQAVGRLLRRESDFGSITLLDSRVITRSYGRRLLDALPLKVTRKHPEVPANK